MTEPNSTSNFTVGTRGSQMARIQTQLVVDQLKAAWPDLSAMVEVFNPIGDRDQVARLTQHGGKGGAFVAEIRDAMRDGRLNAAMHSLKDMPGDEEAPGLTIGAYLARDDARDALVLREGLSLEAFLDPATPAVIGAGSVRRAALLQRLYPFAKAVHYRGAVDTRLKKLDGGVGQELPDGTREAPADALVLSVAGLRRLGFESRIAHIFSPDEILPAVGQGIVAVECSLGDFEARQKLAKIDNRRFASRRFM